MYSASDRASRSSLNMSRMSQQQQQQQQSSLKKDFAAIAEVEQLHNVEGEQGNMIKI